jgi:sacsin
MGTWQVAMFTTRLDSDTVMATESVSRLMVCSTWYLGQLPIYHCRSGPCRNGYFLGLQLPLKLRSVNSAEFCGLGSYFCQDGDLIQSSGRLYSVLPLSIMTWLPVHIHGQFSFPVDRSRLHGLEEPGAQNHRSGSWNKFLFDQAIPKAWTGLLTNLCKTRPAQNFFHLWPDSISDTHQLWSDMGLAVIEIVAQKEEPVWFTELGNVSIKDGLLTNTRIEDGIKEACREANISIVYLKDGLFEETCKMPQSRRLCPKTLSEELRDGRRLEGLSSKSKMVVLDYLKDKVPFTDLATLAIFPFQDGIFRSLVSPPIFVHRDTLDRRLFTNQPKFSIDTDRVSSTTSAWLHGIAKNSTLVRHRNPTDLGDYLTLNMPNEERDTIFLDEGERSILLEAWQWIMRHCEGDLPVSIFESLWLVPLRDSIVRRLVPVNHSCSATWFDAGKKKELALKIVALDPGNAPRMVADDVLTHLALGHVLSSAARFPSLRLKDGRKYEGFLGFLEEGRDLLKECPEDLRDSVLQLVKELHSARGRININSERSIIRSLPIFQEIQWPTDTAKSVLMNRFPTDLTRTVTFVGLKALVPVPSSSDRVLIDATDEKTCLLLEDLGLARCLHKIQIIEEIAIPALQVGGYEHMNSAMRHDLAELIFQSYFRLSLSAKNMVPSLPIIPLERKGDDEKACFSCPTNIVDPQRSTLLNLFFEDEMCRPEKTFYNRYSGLLTSCGAMDQLDERLILDRIRTYGTNKLPFEQVASRARTLLQMSPGENRSWSAEFVSAISSYSWLPAKSPDGTPSLTGCFQCRDQYDQPIIGHVWSHLPFYVQEGWRIILGWHFPVQVDVLMSQLGKSIEASDRRSIEQVLVYLSRNYLLVNYMRPLSELRFIESDQDLLVSPSRACRQGAEKLIPYLYNVDLRFWNQHNKLLTDMHVPATPDLKQLRYVQNELQLKAPLGEVDIDVAVEIARIWSFQPKESLKGLKMPDEGGLLVDLEDLTYNDSPYLSEMGCSFSHPKLSRAIGDRLGVRHLSERLNCELGISALEDDQFDGREETTNEIRDVLNRYTPESTFREYLADADDRSSSSAVKFLVDETNYDTTRLVTEELGVLQGPALLIYNDSGENAL